MDIIAAVLTIVILGILYWRMIKRETPERVGVFQALLPLGPGIASMFLGGLATVLVAKAAGGMSNLVAGDTSFGFSLLRSFLMAGLTEETAKLLMILLALVILKSRVKNVYEYVLIGAAVGFGFAIAEEFFYADFSAASDASDYLGFVIRMISVPAHMTLNMVMGEFLGRAKYSRLTGKGSPALNIVLAIFIPMCVHSLYDACTVFNSKLLTGAISGTLLALAGYVGLMIYEIAVLIRFRKKTEEFCGMHTV